MSFALLEESHQHRGQRPGPLGLLYDLTPIHELCYVLLEGASVYTDKAYNSSDDEATLLIETGMKLVPTRRKNMKEQNTLSEFFALQRYR